MIETIGIIANPYRIGIQTIVIELIEWLERYNKTVFVSDTLLPLGNHSSKACPDKELGKRSQLVLAIGGDGNFLTATKAIGEHGNYLLGVNVGRLGFLTETTLEELYPFLLEKVFTGKFEIEERMLLKTFLERDGEKIICSDALNDVVVHKGAFAGIIELVLYVNDDVVGTYLTDGLVISTPTGSTAYGLSAGGPVLSPFMEALVATPICAHSLAVRSIVVSGKDKFKLEIKSENKETILNIDGHIEHHLQAGDILYIEKADYTAKFLKPYKHSFYEVLRTKLQWGAR